MALEITPETIGIFLLFVIVLFVLSRVLKVFIHAVLIAIAGFSFPWIVQYLGLGLPITADITTGLQFAMIGVGLYLVYEFFHVVIAIIKIILLPLKILFKGSSGRAELEKIKREMRRKKVF